MTRENGTGWFLTTLLMCQLAPEGNNSAEMKRTGKFRIGLTRDFLTPTGELSMGDIALRLFENEPRVSYGFLSTFSPEVSPEQIADYDAIILMGPRFTHKTLSETDLKLSVIARFGVGYDNVDVAALTERDCILTITPNGVRRPVATAIVTFILALTHELFAKDRLVRHGNWQDKPEIRARGLSGRVLGSIGIGNIGRDLFHLIRAFEMVHIATDPFVRPEDVADLRVDLVDLETLMRRSDFICINCPLTPETRGMIGERELGWMKRTAYFINTARGSIVDQVALYRFLKERRIRGAALDVFSTEPLPDGDPLTELDNVILTPHSICWTDECFQAIGESAAQSVLAILSGQVPANVVNAEVLQRPGMNRKLEANSRRWQSLPGDTPND